MVEVYLLKIHTLNNSTISMDSCNLFGDKWSCVFLDATTSVGRLFFIYKGENNGGL